MAIIGRLKLFSQGSGIAGLFTPFVAFLLGVIGATRDAEAAIVVGDVAIIGWLDNGSPVDQFAFVALANIAAGEKVYFTDNGWQDTGAFRGATATDGNGSENGLLLWTAATDVAAGTIVGFTSASSPGFTTGGSIPGVSGGNFGALDFAQSGEQIYAFQGSDSNPLFNPTTHLFVLDDTGAFETASNSNTGDNPGLTLGATAVTFDQDGANNNYMAFNTTVISSGTKDQWLQAIGNQANWTFGVSGAMPSGSINVSQVPEPASSSLLAIATLVGFGCARRRESAKRRNTAASVSIDIETLSDR